MAQRVSLKLKTDGYTETGGGFPAVFNESSETISDWRLGFDADYEINDKNRILYTLEGVNRTSNSGNGVSGNVIGCENVEGIVRGKFTGAIDDYRVYDLAFSKEKVEQMYFEVAKVGVCNTPVNAAMDLVADCVINIKDLQKLMERWMENNIYPVLL